MVAQGTRLVAVALMLAFCVSAYAQEKKSGGAAGETTTVETKAESQKGTGTIVDGIDKLSDGFSDIIKGTGRLVVGTVELVGKVIIAPFELLAGKKGEKKQVEATKTTETKAAEPAKK